MAASVHERLYQLVTGNPGTGAVTVGAAVSGYQALVAGDNANTFDVCIFDVDANGNPNGKWEVQAQSAYTSATTSLARSAGNVVDGSSGAGVLVNFSSGTQRVLNVLSTAGVWIVRKTGGTAGVHEGQLSYTSESFNIANPDTGQPIIQFSLGGSNFWSMHKNGELLNTTQSSSASCGFIPPNVSLTSSSQVQWSSTGALTGAFDVGIKRAAAGVIVPTDASTGRSWLQDDAGGAALQNNFTNNNGTLTATNFSFAVKSGRSYRITGMLQVANSVAAEGVQFDFAGGSATATTFSLVSNAIGTNTPGAISSPSLVSIISYSSINGTNFLMLSGYLLVLSGGTLIMRMAENTTATGTLTLSAGSWIKLADTVLV